MGFKQLFIKSKTYLSYKNNSLHVKNEFIDTLVSLDDIDIMLIENQQTTITATLISHLAQHDISVIFVDEYFNPSAISHGLYKNSRTTKIQHAQVSIKKPQHKRLWKAIIKAKVLHQASVLNTIKHDDYLYLLATKVKSGDSDNVEALAASYYFKALFGKDFVRSSEKDARNGALNYGYSIIRSSIVRHIIAYGLNPAFGMWHSNQLNAFNLADDFIEPFRPVIDLYVLNNISKNSTLSKQHKQDLVALLYYKVEDSFHNNISLTSAIKNMVASYQSFCIQKREDIDIFSIGALK